MECERLCESLRLPLSPAMISAVASFGTGPAPTP
jgi:hypothetical protein